MSQAFPKTLVVDLGRSYTKAFVVNISENKLVIEKKTVLPTSVGDPIYTVRHIGEKLKLTKDTPIFVTGSLAEAEDLSKQMDATYVPKEEAEKAVKKALSTDGFKDPIILDAEETDFSPNLKVDQLGAFLSRPVSEADIENYLGNKSLRPHTIPETKGDLEIEEAFLRFAFSRNSDFVKEKDFLNLVFTGSFFSQAPKESNLALVILDILARGRLAQTKLDKDMFIYSWGALLTKYPQVGEVENDFMLDLGAFVSFGGEGSVLIDYGFTENQELEIMEDEIALVPAHKDQKVQISLLSTRDKLKYKLNGGAFGILLDGRIKPLKLSYNTKDSQEAVKRWQGAIDKLEMIE